MYLAAMAARARAEADASSAGTRAALEADMADRFDGEDDIQQAVWQGPGFRPYTLGHVPHARRLPNPDLISQRVLLENESLHLAPNFKEFMRQQIRDTEWDEVPFRGERAHYRTALQHRRLPIINNWDSMFSVWGLSKDNEDHELVPPLPYLPTAYVHNRSRENSDKYNVWMAQDQRVLATVQAAEEAE